MTLTWMTVILAAGTLGGLAVIMAIALGWANRAFYVRVDPRIEAATNALPGANCGGCGFVGCAQYAEAVVNDGAPVNLCPVGGPSTGAALAAILGVEFEETAPLRPVIHCSATEAQRHGKSTYLGEMTCVSANLIVGVQACVYGCLGLGDCVRACEFGAIRVVDGLATVDYESCNGCGACARACARNIISMTPFKSGRMLVVGCSDRDFGQEVKAVCEVGCIGCKLCEKNSDLIHMDGFLPVIDYQAYQPAADFTEAVKKCRPGCLIFAGKAEPEDMPEAAALPQCETL